MTDPTTRSLIARRADRLAASEAKVDAERQAFYDLIFDEKARGAKVPDLAAEAGLSEQRIYQVLGEVKARRAAEAEQAAEAGDLVPA